MYGRRDACPTTLLLEQLPKIPNLPAGGLATGREFFMRWSVVLSCVLAMLCAVARGQAPVPVDESFTPSPEFQEWLTDLVREHIPH